MVDSKTQLYSINSEEAARAISSDKNIFVRITANITVNGITIPSGTKGFICGYGDKHFIGNYYDAQIYSWFMNGNGTNKVIVLSHSN